MICSVAGNFDRGSYVAISHRKESIMCESSMSGYLQAVAGGLDVEQLQGVRGEVGQMPGSPIKSEIIQDIEKRIRISEALGISDPADPTPNAEAAADDGADVAEVPVDPDGDAGIDPDLD